MIIGLLPVNNGFQPTEDGIEIFVSSNAVHADIVVPIRTTTIDWRNHFPSHCFAKDTSAANYVAIGWGDRGFFLKTPTWSDLKVSTAANALLWPSDTCLHVALLEDVTPNASTKSVRISVEQYQNLVEYLSGQFARVDGQWCQIPNARYYGNDAFFAANGTYHCLNTCNSWTGRALRACGVRVGWMTPLPRSVFLWLP